MIIDSHAHVNFNAYKDDGDELIKKCLDNNVWVVNVGAEIRTSTRAVEYANKYKEGVYAVVGLYPLHIKIDDSSLNILDNEDFNYQEEFIYADYLDLAKNNKVVAIGEVGLDYHYFKEGDNVELIKKRQAEILIEIIRLANEVNKPLSIHCRDAYKDLLEILKNNPVNKKGVLHSFVGSYKTAREFRELGFKLSFNGIITYSESYDKVLTDTPIEDILVETDCPYLTPSPLDKSERNEPINVRYVIEKIAKVKGMEIDEVIKIVEKNTREVFNI
jgi:TatD DNase family protein